MKKLIRQCLRRFGYEIQRPGPRGPGPYFDARHLLGDIKAPCVIDVGANIGQSLGEILECWPPADVHCFEPEPTAREQLSRLAAGHPKVKVNASALGPTSGEREFHRYDGSTMHSFLPPDDHNAHAVEGTIRVATDTLDEYCERNRIDGVDVLKLDAQGYDLEVLKGAERLLDGARIVTLLIELNFARYYQGQASAGELIDYLVSKGFFPYKFYPLSFASGRGGWCDGLFLHGSRKLPYR